MMISSNPATGEILGSFPEHDGAQVERHLATASQAQRSWSLASLDERIAALRRFADVLRDHKGEMARLATLEMGKPIGEAEGELTKSAINFDFYADAAPAMLQDEIIASSARDSRVVRQPLGLVLAVMPWNYPFWQVMRAVAPILVSGNGLVLKHASNVPQCALAIERLAKAAGLPDGVLTTLLVGSATVPSLIADDRIVAVTFTGSTPAGRSIASAAGQALKKQVLELGGSDPFIVLRDADIAAAAKVAVKARFQNTGQSCIAAKRFIVQAEIADAFSEAFCAEVDALMVGNPLDPDVTQGSMARRNLRDELDIQVNASRGEGARVLRGGAVVAGPGAFYEPTVMDNVTLDMTVAREETFGPVAAILRAKDAEEAIRFANHSVFGLGAAIWTADLDRAASLAREIEAGAVFVNGLVASDPRLPFGGIKQSGYGRELGALGLQEFTNAKTIWTGPAQ